MSGANDNAAPRALNLPQLGLVNLADHLADRLADAGGRGIVAGGLDHAAVVSVRPLVPSSGKSAPATGSNLRAGPPEVAMVAGVLVATGAYTPASGETFSVILDGLP